MVMTVEMRKTLLLMGGFCFIVVLVEEILNSGTVSKKITSSLTTVREIDLATDHIDLTSNQETDNSFNSRDGTDEDRMRYHDINENKDRMIAENWSRDVDEDKTESSMEEQRKKEEIIRFGEIKDKEKDKDVYYFAKDNVKYQNDDEKEDEEKEDEFEKYRLENSPYIISPEDEKRLSTPPVMNEMKLISEWKRLIPYKHSFERCRYNMCRWEPNNTLADGVLFRAGAIRTWIIKPFRRKPGQRWILYTNDPAIKSYGLERDDVGHNFNATSTYQLHSDYPRTFGHLQRVTPPKKDYGKIYDGKSRYIAWFVSHCSTWSKRELYVERMRKIIPVDVFGACGNLTCGASHFRGNDTNVCLPMLSERYMFYLAFENSFCKDYVSEKFFKLFQGVDVIPVVQGAFDYHKYMPSNIFIDSSDFMSPEDLAHYLLDVSKNKDHYIRMLKEKAKWTYRGADPLHCVVCEKLHTDTRTHFHTDMISAFNGRPSECYKPKWMKEEDNDDDA
ncbi:alpha-(1,3)-fucosyltransferase c-like [Plakobranchus ocellatus]|uniref:Fucosyltransferase n=1 Tax=Plakobranchus ocellatus TaxID=259542 RepID=A0AAV4C3E0_9GAST|nr:alpha-(1,3)-fucosyltransferase c-like [Plakobranchus ocellatus]